MAGEGKNRFGPNAWATDYPPVLLVGDLPEHLDVLRWRENVYLVGQSHSPARLGHGLSALHLDGAGVFGGRFCTSPSDLPDDEMTREDLIRRFGGEARGAMALYAADSRTGELLLLPDQMSAAVVFVYRSPSLAACSTSLRALARTLREVGVPLTKSTDFFMELLASEAGGHTPSPYEEIESAPLHSYLTISARGIEMHRYPTFADLYQPDIDYREQLDLAAEEIVENAALAAAQPGTRTSHLTAGADSRLVGAALTAAGVDSSFVFFCGENAVTREQDIARRIAGHMGWTMTKHPGTSSAFRIAGDMQKRLATLEASEGVKSVGQHEGSLRAEGVVLTGYNGEAIRSFYSHRVEQVSPGEFSADAYMRAVWPEALWSPDSGLGHPEVLASVRSAMDRDVSAARDAGIPTQTIGDYLYFKARNRYFAWHSAMEASRYRAQFTPLYSPAMVRLAMSVPLADRVTGRITFDLFRLLAPKALEVPFDSMKFSGEVRAEWEQLPLKKLSEVPEAVYDRRTPPRPAQTFSRLAVPEITSAHIARARALTGVTAADLASEELYRRIVRDLARRAKSPVLDALHPERLRLLTNRAPNTRIKVRLLGRLVAYLPWYSDAPW